MKAVLLIFILLLFYTGCVAQKSTFVTVNAGKNIMDVLSSKEVFYYPAFTGGSVFLRDGTSVTAKLNYNRLVDEIHFINPKGDTLALANERNIKYIVIASDTFYYDAGYVRLLASGKRMKVAYKEIWIISDARKIGAYNTTNSSASISSYTSYNESGRLYDLTVNEDVVLKKTTQFYLGDSYNHFVPAGKKNLLLLFPKEERQIEQFLKKTKIGFKEQNDIHKMMQFIELL